ncbi:MAG: hypothetical protein KGV56_04215 [Gammaproteobacteria bacterium]|nr:hypothetical protein [Gammaproteobacteria bacterium]
MLMLRVDLSQNSEDWDNDTIALMCEFVPFITAYFATRVKENETADTPKEIKQLDIEALATCTNELQEEIAESMPTLNAIRYGFNYDDSFQTVIEIQNCFSELGIMLRDYRRAYEKDVEEEDNA